mmetsp:Transcript_78958/g.239546  ORF Transcript_78958/g.239546 Transcript_78958/m.239546 type:complete len:251 (-) Transcript_78958:1198-1950(-)
MLEAFLLPLGLVLIPIFFANLQKLLQWVRPVVELVLVWALGGTLLLQPRAHAVDDDACCHLELDVCHVRRPLELLVRLLLGKLRHEAHTDHALVLLRKVVQVLVGDHVAVRSDASREGREVCRVHPQRVNGNDAPPVARAPAADDLLHLVQPVELEVAQQAQRLDDVRHVFQLPAAHQVDRVVGEPLDRALYVLHLAVDDCEEGHVADAEAAVLDDGRAAAVLGRMHRRKLPGVAHVRGDIEHRLEHLQH